MSAREVDLREFIDLGIKPRADEMAAAGVSDFLVIVDVPAAGLMRIYSPLAPGARADALERLAEKAREAAAQLRKQPGQSIFAPGTLKLSGVTKP